MNKPEDLLWRLLTVIHPELVVEAGTPAELTEQAIDQVQKLKLIEADWTARAEKRTEERQERQAEQDVGDGLFIVVGTGDPMLAAGVLEAAGFDVQTAARKP